MRIAVYPGSFDPVTMGHIDIIRRAAAVADELHVCILKNPKKHYWFSQEERLALLRESTAPFQHVVIDAYAGLLTDYAHEIGASVIIKGLRNTTDFMYESQMDYFNKRLAPDIETVYLVSDNRYAVLSSSAIRELMTFGGNLEGLVPEPVLKAVRRRQERQKHNG